MNMKISVLATISGITVVILGLLITLGPRFIFKACSISAETSRNSSSCESGSEDCGCEEDASETAIIDSAESCGCGTGSEGCGSSIVLPKCYYSVQALAGIGILIAALGLCMIVFENMLIQFGLSIGVFFSSIIALFIPNGLIGMCLGKNMACRTAALPAITILCIILLAASAVYTTFVFLKKPE